jgi:adenylate cyclase
MAVFGQPEPRPDDAARALACATQLIVVLDEWRRSVTADNAESFRAGIGLHYGPVVGGVLESGFHDEFTVIGDAVNIAQRLEGLSKRLDASLVVSVALLNAVKTVPALDWVRQNAVTLRGRQKPIDIAYLRRPDTGAPSAYVVGVSHTDFQRSPIHR